MLGLKYKVGKEAKFHPMTEDQVQELTNILIGTAEESPDQSHTNAMSWIETELKPEEWSRVKEYHIGNVAIVKVKQITTFVEDK